MSQTILIVDDEVNLRKTLAEILGGKGYEILEAGDGSEAIDLLGTVTPDLVFTDWRMPKMGGEEVLRYIRNEQRLAAIPVIVITAFGSSHNAIEAVRLGAYDFVMKPFDLEEISLTVERALAHSSLNREVMDLRARIERQSTLGTGRLIGSSPRMLDAFKMIGVVHGYHGPDLRRVGNRQGTCGGGNSQLQPPKRQRLRGRQLRGSAGTPVGIGIVRLRTGGLYRSLAAQIGRFEMAEGGTIFLDEIGELSQNIQAKLLRVLQDHGFERLGGTETIRGDFRVLAATNRDLDVTVRERLFREDLFYRLNVVRITVPPLRERRAESFPAEVSFWPPTVKTMISRQLVFPRKPFSCCKLIRIPAMYASSKT